MNILGENFNSASLRRDWDAEAEVESEVKSASVPYMFNFVNFDKMEMMIFKVVT